MDSRDQTAAHGAGVVEPLASGQRALGQPGFSHAAMLYGSDDEYLAAIEAFAREAAAAASPLHAVLPPPAMRRVRGRLPWPTSSLLADMSDLGRNPARIIPAAQSYADSLPGSHLYCLWEPAWPGRSPAEQREIARHEALCNLAFRGQNMTILCLYDAARLGGTWLTGAARTHPFVTAHGRHRASGEYLGPGHFPQGSDDPLPAPGDARTVTFGDHLAQVRAFVASQASTAGIASERASDLVLAVSEIAANALGHAGGGGTVRAWCSGTHLICQIDDGGHIVDPLAGRRRRPPDAAGGHGLWLVNSICDLVERRTGPAGTTTRLHMRLPVSDSAPSEA